MSTNLHERFDIIGCYFISKLEAENIRVPLDPKANR